LVTIYCLSFCLLWKTFIAPPILNDSFAGYNILGLKFFLFSAWNTSLHIPLAFKVSVEKSAAFWWAYLYMLFVFSLTAFNILSLFSVLVVLMIICHEKFYFSQICLVSWKLPLPEWA
jgi:hypothetical protein